MLRSLKSQTTTSNSVITPVKELTRHVKEYMDLAMGIPIASGLPSDKRRDEFEARVWIAMQDAAEFMKTKEAAKNAKARVGVMEVMAALATVHLQIMKYQD